MSYYRKLFPSLKNIGVTHCWAGNLALTADGRPHIGSDNGIHYCATGNISMAIYLGSKIAKGFWAQMIPKHFGSTSFQ